MWIEVDEDEGTLWLNLSMAHSIAVEQSRAIIQYAGETYIVKAVNTREQIAAYLRAQRRQMALRVG